MYEVLRIYVRLSTRRIHDMSEVHVVIKRMHKMCQTEAAFGRAVGGCDVATTLSGRVCETQGMPMSRRCRRVVF